MTNSRRPLLAAVLLVFFAVAGGFMMVKAQAETSGNLLGGVNGPDVAARANAGGKTKDGQPGGNTSKSSDKNAQDKKAQDKSKKKEDKSKDSSATAPVTPPVASKPVAVPPAAPVPQPLPTGIHDNIITTIFWAGEAADASNAFISNAPSAWDGLWSDHYGGYDDPDHRNGYHPAGFTPKENPFYVALPYNDLDANGKRKASAGNCPNTSNIISWCKNAWIKVTKGGKTAYAQWQDVGPMLEDDAAYVFGSARPSNVWGAKAGLDVSPAVRDYIGLSDVDTTSWSFVSAGSVPAGPWKDIVTTSQGGW